MALVRFLLPTLLLIATIAVPCAAQVFEYGGIRIGMTYAEYWKAMDTTDWSYLNPADSSVKKDEYSLAPRPAEAGKGEPGTPAINITRVVFVDGYLSSMAVATPEFSNREAKQVRDASNAVLALMKGTPFTNQRPVPITPDQMTENVLMSLEPSSAYYLFYCDLLKSRKMFADVKLSVSQDRKLQILLDISATVKRK